MYKIIINTHRKVKENTKYPETERFWLEVNRGQQNTEVNKSSNQRKCIKSDQKNWKQLKNSK